MSYIQIKPGVDMSGLSPAIWSIAHSVAKVFEARGFACVITSAFRPQKPGSLHHGYALDFRANHIRNENALRCILEQIKQSCGADYDVLLHGEGANIHYHIEYDPE